ncbi:MAG: pseudouridine synthase [Saprospiraceae bacterium]|nr:pseudouridine synthase [Saprospiraceae bacterium]
MSKFQYIAFHKPYGVLSQFTREHPDHVTLADYLKDIDKDIYPVGRLDKDSEGLLILTNDKSLTEYLLNSRNRHPRTYWAQVDGAITPDAIEQLKRGVVIRPRKITYTTLPCEVKKIKSPSIPDRDPPIRYRKEIPTSWIKMTLVEGKYRQVRKMCAAVGFPVLRLLRVKIGNLKLEGLDPGDYRMISKEDII